MLVVRDLFAGKSRFGEFAASPEGIATNILTERLSRLLDGGIVEAKASPSREGALEYRLTARGRKLLPVLRALKEWGLAHIPGTVARITAG